MDSDRNPETGRRTEVSTLEQNALIAKYRNSPLLKTYNDEGGGGVVSQLENQGIGSDERFRTTAEVSTVAILLREIMEGIRK